MEHVGECLDYVRVDVWVSEDDGEGFRYVRSCQDIREYWRMVGKDSEMCGVVRLVGSTGGGPGVVGIGKRTLLLGLELSDDVETSEVQDCYSPL